MSLKYSDADNQNIDLLNSIKPKHDNFYNQQDVASEPDTTPFYLRPNFNSSAGLYDNTDNVLSGIDF